MNASRSVISIVVPVYNEAGGLRQFHASLAQVLKKVGNNHEIIYVDDGSTDGTNVVVKEFAESDPHVKLLALSRNFGKEIAITAGIHAARGDAIVTIDADGQHPVDLLPRFINRWKDGSKLVIGVRTDNQREGALKRYGSKVFYKLFNRFSSIKLVPGTTDFRLIDKQVQAEFARMTERNRITRGLIDWLGYDRDYIYFKANPRLVGSAGYTFTKLAKLGVDSIISLSSSPLYLVAYIGAIVLPLSTLAGLVMFVNFVFGDPLGLNATASSYVIVFMLFLIGVLLVSQGIIGLYLSHIHTETQNRPLYIIDEEKSLG